MSLDPQAKALLDQLAADPDAPRLIDLPPEGGREMYRAMAGMLDLQGVAIGKVEDRTIPGPGGEICSSRSSRGGVFESREGVAPAPPKMSGAAPVGSDATIAP